MARDDSDLVVETIAKADWEQREVYARFGLAVYFCQALETQLVNYLALLRRVTTGQAMPTEEVDGLFDRLFRRTFGSNLRDVTELVGSDSVLVPTMAAALTLRNELVHHWLRDRAVEQGTSHGRLAVVEELKVAQAQLQRADEELRAQSKLLWARAGLSWDWVEEEYVRLARIAEQK